MKSFLMCPVKYPLFAFLLFGLFAPIAKSETKISSMNDSGFLHLRETKSDSATNDHYIRFSHIISISIYDDREHGFYVTIRTAGIRSASGESSNIIHSLDFKTREEAEETVRRLLDAIAADK